VAVGTCVCVCVVHADADADADAIRLLVEMLCTSKPPILFDQLKLPFFGIMVPQTCGICLRQQD
jgi:hypothetical protein